MSLAALKLSSLCLARARAFSSSFLLWLKKVKRWICFVRSAKFIICGGSLGLSMSWM